MTSCLTSWTISCALSYKATKLPPNLERDGSSGLSCRVRVKEGRLSKRRVCATSKRMPNLWMTYRCKLVHGQLVVK